MSSKRRVRAKTKKANFQRMLLMLAVFVLVGAQILTVTATYANL